MAGTRSHDHFSVLSFLPPRLRLLAELALDMRWSWSHATDVVWERIDPDMWHSTRNPWLILKTVSLARLKKMADSPEFRKLVEDHVRAQQEGIKRPVWFQAAHPGSPLIVAYFSMEFGLGEALPIYSGGLGILAGDFLKTASDLGVPLVGVGLLYQQGYFRQALDGGGGQIEYFPYNDPSQLPIMAVRDRNGEWLRVEIEFPGRRLYLRTWQARVGRATLFLLDSNDPMNTPPDRGITSELYGGGPELRLQQEIVLGIGGWRLLRALGISPQICHLNEGHAALAALERARCFMTENRRPFDVSLTATRSGNIFTTHTPVEAGFDCFDHRLVGWYLNEYAETLGIGLGGLMALGRRNPGDNSEPLNMAYLAIRGSGAVNGVSRLHGEVSRRIFRGLFPRWPEREIPVTSVTNGAHMPSWDSALADRLWSDACGKGRWIGSMDTVVEDIRKENDETLWAFRRAARRELVLYVRERFARQLASAGASKQTVCDCERLLDPETLTIGFARRFAAYKRPNMLLARRDRLIRLLTDSRRPVQLVIAGKAHPRDESGKALVREWSVFVRSPEIRSRAVFLSDYDMDLAEHLVQGVDLWMNTPRRPWEACGTSGMKVLINGGLNLSELDGWWAEAYRPEVGWALGDGREHGDDEAWDEREAEQLYRILEEEVVPAFYDRDARGIPRGWIARIRTSMAELTPEFSSNRMLREYVERLYLKAADDYSRRTVKKGRMAAELQHGLRYLRDHWSKLRFGSVEAKRDGGHYTFSAKVYVGDFDTDMMNVQLYADAIDEGDPEIHEMKKGEVIRERENVCCFYARIPALRPAEDYTPRIIPHLKGAHVPLESPHILWYR